MKYITEGMEPKEVLQYFEQICSIPHGSGNESALAQYIIRIAEEKGLENEMDQYGNVLVRLVSSPGAENAPYFLMQGHMDMVCEKEDWCDLDMEKEPVQLRRDGNILYAHGTTLGADNAVGLCNMLAVMTDDTLKHPPMELLFTVEEETGMDGIASFDMTKLKSRRMLTMDCGDPDVLILGSAGNLNFDLQMELCEEAFGEKHICRTLQVEDLHGGHTGLEAGSGYANALSMMTVILAELEQEFAIRLCSLKVGGGPGSIPSSAKVVLAVPAAKEDEVKLSVEKLTAEFCGEFSITEPSMKWAFEKEEAPEKMLTAESCRDFIDFISFAQVGAMKRHPASQHQVLGSALIKCAEVCGGRFTGLYAIRSNTDPYKYMLGKQFTRLADRYGVSYEVVDDSPAWPEKPESALTKICVEVYKNRFGNEPHQELVHGGEEASYVSSRVPDMEIVGIAPYSRGAHTPKERLHLDTMLPIWQFITDLLERLSRE